MSYEDFMALTFFWCFFPATCISNPFWSVVSTLHISHLNADPVILSFLDDISSFRRCCLPLRWVAKVTWEEHCTWHKVQSKADWGLDRNLLSMSSIESCDGVDVNSKTSILFLPFGLLATPPSAFSLCSTLVKCFMNSSLHRKWSLHWRHMNLLPEPEK